MTHKHGTRPFTSPPRSIVAMGVVVAVILTLTLTLTSSAGAGEPFTSLTFYPDLFADHRRTVLFLDRIVEQPPMIDGRLDDACWSHATRFEGLHEMESGLPAPADVATEGFVARGTDGLFLAVRARRAPLPPAWKDGSGQADPAHPELASQGLDTFSFLFNPDIRDFTRCRFTIGKDGLRSALRHYMIPAWQPEGWQSAYVASADHITLESFIPWNLLRDQPVRDGDVMAFNLHRYTTSFTPVPTGPYRYQIGDHYVWQSARCHSMETVDHHPWLYFGTKKAFEADPPAPVVRVYLDKVAYDALDESGEAYVEVRGSDGKLDGLSLEIEIVDAAGQTLQRRPAEA